MVKKVYLGTRKAILTNQIKNGKFKNTSSYWSRSTSYYSYSYFSDYAYAYVKSATTSTNIRTAFYQDFDSPIIGNDTDTNRKIYMRAKILGNANNTNPIFLGFRQYLNGATSITIRNFTYSNITSWTYKSQIIETYDGTNKREIIGFSCGIHPNATANDEFKISEIIVVDLTESFGHGYEPTQEWCDQHIPYFEGTIAIDSYPYTIPKEIDFIYLGGTYNSNNNKAKRIKKGYIGINNKARLFFDYTLTLSYSGSWSNQIVTMDNKQYRLLTLTSSGTLTASRVFYADYWICSSGVGGYSYEGGSGGVVQTENNIKFPKTAIIEIGAADTAGLRGNDSSITINGIQKLAHNAHYSSGGSGGGSSGAWPDELQEGDHIQNKKPFNSSYFAYPYCDGGGAGTYHDVDESDDAYSGGAGGTNGSDGNLPTLSTVKSMNYGPGGGQYGGDGARLRYNSGLTGALDATPGTGFGSGGGGGAYINVGGHGVWSRDEAYGSQGVCFIRIPIE